jgi:hypothetical protein
MMTFAQAQKYFETIADFTSDWSFVSSNYQALELANRAEKLGELGLASLAAGFNAPLRNAISHGGVHYSDYEIR